MVTENVELHAKEENLTKEGSEFANKLHAIVFGTMMALNARPALIDREYLTNVVPAKKDKPRKEFWSPNVIGRNYRLPRQEPVGTHSSPRLHWRRGHFRQQPYGLGRKERKQIWLEPTLVGAETEKGEQTSG
jgi:hypothetical protein